MPSADSAVIAKTFDTYIRNFIEMEVLYKKGASAGLQYSPEVKKYVQMWSEFYAFETLRGGILDTVRIPQDQIKLAFNKLHKEPADKRDPGELKVNETYEEASPKLKRQMAWEKIKNKIDRIFWD